MKSLGISILAALAISACGGGGDSVATEGCNGSGKSAVVYLGSQPFPELASVPDACFFRSQATAPDDVKAVVEHAKATVGWLRVYMIGTDEGAGAAMAYMSRYPGNVDIASLWNTSSAASFEGLRGSLVSIYLNGASCEPMAQALRDQGTVAVCKPGAFDGSAAVGQLNLSGVLR